MYSESDTRREEIYILDTGVFASSYAHLFHDSVAITTSFVIEEVKSARARLELEKLRYTSLNVIDPNKEEFEEVMRVVKDKNLKLSHADISLAALALRFHKKGKKVVVVTEDYTLQNLCSFLSIPFMSVEKEGIKRRLEWIRICPACNRIVSENEEFCPVCGSETRYILKK